MTATSARRSAPSLPSARRARVQVIGKLLVLYRPRRRRGAGKTRPRSAPTRATARRGSRPARRWTPASPASRAAPWQRPRPLSDADAHASDTPSGEADRSPRRSNRSAAARHRCARQLLGGSSAPIAIGETKTARTTCTARSTPGTCSNGAAPAARGPARARALLAPIAHARGRRLVSAASSARRFPAPVTPRSRLSRVRFACVPPAGKTRS